jgi:hypothetical protein
VTKDKLITLIKKISPKIVVAMVAFVILISVTLKEAQCFVPAMPSFGFGGGCTFAGQAVITNATVAASLKTSLTVAATTIELFISNTLNLMLNNLLGRVNDAETNFQEWWRMWWAYDLRPSWSDQAAQLTAAEMDAAINFAMQKDAETQMMSELDKDYAELNSHRTHRPNENVCTIGSITGGMNRANILSRNMRRALSLETANNALGGNAGSGNLPTVSAGSITGPTAEDKQLYKFTRYINHFCDEKDNNSPAFLSGCASNNTKMRDITVVDNIFQNLTIEFSQTYVRATIEAIFENLMGIETYENIMRSTTRTSAGQEILLDRRSEIARRNAAESTMRLLTAWRTPGSRDNVYVRALRASAGATDMSTNPSYREIMQAMAYDRLATGRLGAEMLTSQAAVEHEKLMTSVFYLMALRDYYELMERWALTLAVQTALEADGRAVPEASNLTAN